MNTTFALNTDKIADTIARARANRVRKLFTVESRHINRWSGQFMELAEVNFASMEQAIDAAKREIDVFGADEARVCIRISPRHAVEAYRASK
jgi:hypothetical protein